MPQTVSQRPTWLPWLTVLGVLAGVFAAVAPSYVERYHVPFRSAAGIYACFVLLLLMVIVPGMRGTRAWLEERLVGRGWLALILIWYVPYVFYAAGAHDWRWTGLIRILSVSAFLTVIYRFFPVSDLRRFCWQDFVAAVWLVGVLLSHQLAGIWNSPVNLDFMGRLLLIGTSSWNWVFIRRVPALGYEFSVSMKTISAAALNFALFAVIAIPSSLALRFTRWNPLHVGLLAFCLSYLEIFLFIALLEELFFRGFLQTLISYNLSSVRGGQLLVSCLFGLFHVLHPPFPNWRYVLLATVAGWFYGSAFLQSAKVGAGSLIAPSLTHAMVDTVWRTFFSRG